MPTSSVNEGFSGVDEAILTEADRRIRSSS